MNAEEFDALKKATTIRLYPPERFFQAKHPAFFTIRGVNIPTEEYRALTDRPHAIESIYGDDSFLRGSFTISGYCHWLPRECIQSFKRYEPLDSKQLESIRPRQFVKIANYADVSDFLANRKMDWYLSSQIFWGKWYVVQNICGDEVDIGTCKIDKSLIVGLGPVLYKLGDSAEVLTWQSIKEIYGLTKNSHKEIVVNGFRHHNYGNWDNQLKGEVLDIREESVSKPSDTLVYKLKLNSGDEMWFNWAVLRCPPEKQSPTVNQSPIKLLQIDNYCTRDELWKLIKENQNWSLEVELCSWERAKAIAGKDTDQSFRYKTVYYYRDNQWGKTLKVNPAIGSYGDKNELVEEIASGHAYIYHVDFIEKLIIRFPGGKVMTYKPSPDTRRTPEQMEYSNYFRDMLQKIDKHKIIIARFFEPQEIREMPGVGFTGLYSFEYENRTYSTKDYPWGIDCQITWEGGEHVRVAKNGGYYHLDFVKAFSVFSGPGNSPAEKTYKRDDYALQKIDTSAGSFTVTLPPTQLGMQYIVKEKKEENKMKKEDIAKLNINGDNLKSAAKEVKAQRDKKDQETAKSYLTQLLAEEDQLVADKTKIDTRLKEVQEMIASLGYPPKD